MRLNRSGLPVTRFRGSQGVKVQLEFEYEIDFIHYTDALWGCQGAKGWGR